MDIQIFRSDAGLEIEYDKDAVCCIVQLPIHSTDPRDIRFLGTGFYLFTSGCIVTAKHLFERSDENYGPHFILNFAPNGDTGLARFLAVPRDIYAHTLCDLAMILIDAKQAPAMKPFLPSRHDFAIDEGLVTIGYKPPMTTAERSLQCSIEVNHVTAVSIGERERTGRPTEFIIEYESPFVTPGNSGGPVLNRAGRVAGVAIEQFCLTHSSDAALKKSMGRATTLKPYLDLGRSGTSPVITSAIRDWILGDFDCEPSLLWSKVEADVVRIHQQPELLRAIEEMEREAGMGLPFDE